MPNPSLVYGIDFSGAKRPDRKIWLARAVWSSGHWKVENCSPVATLPAHPGERDDCLRALTDLIVTERKAIFGLDFPFGLSRKLRSVASARSWREFVLNFDKLYKDAYHFRQICRIDAQNKEYRRATDEQSCTPWCPYNVRLRFQTFYGIRDILKPLIEQNLACVLPMQRRVQGKPWLIEICPASRLKKHEMYRPYKGAGQERRVARETLLDRLLDSGCLQVDSRELRSCVIEDQGGDALDSVLAVWAVAEALSDRFCVRNIPRSSWTLEGYVYS